MIPRLAFCASSAQAGPCREERVALSEDVNGQELAPEQPMSVKVRLKTASPQSNLLDAPPRLAYNGGSEAIAPRELPGRRSRVSDSEGRGIRL